jgi:hypothetical protein
LIDNTVAGGYGHEFPASRPIGICQLCEFQRPRLSFRVLVLAIVSVGGGFVVELFDYGVGFRISVLTTLFWLATTIPSIAVQVRRLHDIDRSGWWLLLAFVPLIGALVLIVWFCTKGTQGYNRFGADYFRPGGYARADRVRAAPR